MSHSFELDTKIRVKEATDIVELASGYLDLRRQGRLFVAHCPWHDDRRPSLQINPERQSWKCWVCNIGGDVFNFVMQREGVGFGEALRMLADRAGIPLERGPSAQQQAQVRDEKQTLYRALSWAEHEFHAYLVNDPGAQAARDYLAARHINTDSIQRFLIGYAPDQWSWLIDRARRSQISIDALEAGGLVSRSDSSGKLLDRFRGRVMFPIRDTQQRPIAFGGRILPEVAQALEQKYDRPPAKYINSPETRVFSKSETLYNLNLARDTVTGSRELIVMEGYTDVVIAWQHGIKQATAVLGTALNERHLKLIRRFADRIILVLDGDVAGQKRSKEILDLFVGTDLDLRILTLPEGLDPADFLEQRGSDAFRELLVQAPDALQFKMDSELRGVDPLRDTHRAHQAAESILSTLSLAPRVTLTDSSSRLREQQIVGRMARQLALPEGALRQRLEDLKKQRRSQSPTGETGRGTPPRESRFSQSRPASYDDASPESGGSPAPVVGPLNRQSWPAWEIELLEILVLAPEKIDLVMENIGPHQFVEGPLKQLFELYSECYQEGQDVDFKTIMTLADDSGLKNLLAELAESVDTKSKFALAQISIWLQHVLTSFHRLEVEQVQRQNLSRLSSHALSDAEEDDALAQLLQEKIREQEIRQNLSTPLEGQ